jgi:hypothetical protein
MLSKIQLALLQYFAKYWGNISHYCSDFVTFDSYFPIYAITTDCFLESQVLVVNKWFVCSPMHFRAVEIDIFSSIHCKKLWCLLEQQITSWAQGIECGMHHPHLKHCFSDINWVKSSYNAKHREGFICLPYNMYCLP